MTLRSDLPLAVKKAVWELKYAMLGYPIGKAPADVVQYISGHVAADCSILELGCGRGGLLRGLRETDWNGHYFGVDISRAAITDAQRHSDSRSSWQVSGIENFRSEEKWDVIALIESLYYVDLENLVTVLQRINSMLTTSGVLLIRLHSFEKHKAYVQIIRQMFPAAKELSETLFCITQKSTL